MGDGGVSSTCNGFTVATGPVLICFPLQEADPNTEMLRLAAKSGFIHKATRQGGQRTLWNLPPCGHGLGAHE